MLVRHRCLHNQTLTFPDCYQSDVFQSVHNDNYPPLSFACRISFDGLGFISKSRRRRKSRSKTTCFLFMFPFVLLQDLYYCFAHGQDHMHAFRDFFLLVLGGDSFRCKSGQWKKEEKKEKLLTLAFPPETIKKRSLITLHNGNCHWTFHYHISFNTLDFQSYIQSPMDVNEKKSDWKLYCVTFWSRRVKTLHTCYMHGNIMHKLSRKFGVYS